MLTATISSALEGTSRPRTMQRLMRIGITTGLRWSDSAVCLGSEAAVGSELPRPLEPAQSVPSSLPYPTLPQLSSVR